MVLDRDLFSYPALSIYVAGPNICRRPQYMSPAPIYVAGPNICRRPQYMSPAPILYPRVIPPAPTTPATPSPDVQPLPPALGCPRQKAPHPNSKLVTP